MEMKIDIKGRMNVDGDKDENVGTHSNRTQF